MSNTDSVRIKVSHVIKTVDCGKDNTLALIIHGIHLLTWLVLVNGILFVVDLCVCVPVHEERDCKREKGNMSAIWRNVD